MVTSPLGTRAAPPDPMTMPISIPPLTIPATPNTPRDDAIMSIQKMEQ